MDVMSLKTINFYGQEPLRLLACMSKVPLEKTCCKDDYNFYQHYQTRQHRWVAASKSQRAPPGFGLRVVNHTSICALCDLENFRIDTTWFLINRDDLSTTVTTLSFTGHCLCDPHHLLPRVAHSDFVAIIRPPCSTRSSTTYSCTHLSPAEPPAYRQFLIQSSFASQSILLQLPQE